MYVCVCAYAYMHCMPALSRGRSLKWLRFGICGFIFQCLLRMWMMKTVVVGSPAEEKASIPNWFWGLRWAITDRSAWQRQSQHTCMWQQGLTRSRGGGGGHRGECKGSSRACSEPKYSNSILKEVISIEMKDKKKRNLVQLGMYFHKRFPVITSNRNNRNNVWVHLFLAFVKAYCPVGLQSKFWAIDIIIQKNLHGPWHHKSATLPRRNVLFVRVLFWMFALS